MLIKRTERQARRGTLAAALAGQRRAASTAAPSCAAPASPSAASPRSARCRSRRVRKADAAGSMATSGATIRKNVCTHCSVGCTVIAEVVNGVWVGQEPGWDSPINRGSHCAKGAATRELVHGDRRLRYPMKLVNGQWTRISLGHRDQRDRRQADGDPRQVGRRLRVLAGLRQVHQRRRVSQPQARRVLGHQQLGPPGAHLPFDHRRRRRQHLGLRRDDQQLHRHPQYQDAVLPGRQSGRGASGVAAASARRQGVEPGQLHRRRSAPDPHRRARHRIRAVAAWHRHPGALGHALAHLQERLGRQAVHRAARLRHGRHPQGGREMDARKKSNASAACPARSSSASPRCSRPTSRRA